MATNKRLEYIVEARNNAKKTLKEAGVDINRLGKEAQQAAVALETLGKAETKFSRTAKAAAAAAKQALGTTDLASAVKKATDVAAAAAGTGGTKIGRALRSKLDEQMKLIRKDLYNIQGTLSGLINNFISRFVVFISGYALFTGAKSMIGDAAYIEQQKTSLEALTGSAEEAGNIIIWVRKQAWKTPFQFPDLVESVTQLKSVGLDYKKWFSSVGNLAMMSGRPLSEGLEMTVRAITRLKSGATGEALELLRRLKISMADFRAQGIQFGAGNRLLGSPDRALEALMRIIATKFPNVMEKAENTATVAFSNIMDAAREVGYAIMGIDQTGGVMEGGLLDKLKKTALELLEWFGTHKAAIQEWGTSVGKAVARVIEELKRLPQWWEKNVWWIKFLVKTILTLALIAKVFPVLRALLTLVAAIVTAYKAWAAGQAIVMAMSGQWVNLAAGLVAAAASYAILNKVMGNTNDLLNNQKSGMDKVADSAKDAVEAIKPPPGAPKGWSAEYAGPGSGKPLSKRTLDETWKDLKKAKAEVAKMEKKLQQIHEKDIPTMGDLGASVAFKQRLSAAKKEVKQLESMLASHGYTTSGKVPKLEKSAEVPPMEPNWASKEDALEASTKAWSKYADMVGRSKGDTSADYENALKTTKSHLVAHAKLLDDAAKATKKFTVEWYAAQEALLDANIAVSEVDDKLRKIPQERLDETRKNKEAAEKKRKDSLREQLDIAKSVVEDYRAMSDYQKEYGSDSNSIQATQGYISILSKLRDEIQQVLPSVGAFSEEGRSFRAELRDINSTIAREQKSLQELPLKQAEGKLGTAQAYLNMIKQMPGNHTGMVKSSTLEVISLEKEKLAILESQLAIAEQMGQGIEADKLRAQIYGVRGEILSMQKDLRTNLETEFDKMSVKIINAPKDIAKTLARSGITLWQKQMESMSKLISMPQASYAYAGSPGVVKSTPQVAPPQVDVRVQIDGQELASHIETYVDKRLGQWGVK